MTIIAQSRVNSTRKGLDISEPYTRIQLKENSIAINVDTEYQPVTDQCTKPISIQLQGFDLPEKLYLHPDAEIKAPYRNHPTFKSPFVVIDYLNVEWRRVNPDTRSKKYLNIDAHIFFSFKDLEFMFSDREDYVAYVLAFLERTRRARISNGHKNCTALPYEVRVYDKSGKLRWMRLSLKVDDICAMQGLAGLSTYAQNVGLAMDTKDTYNSEEKGRMLDMYLKDPKKFELYALGDTPLEEIKFRTNNFYNSIAALLGLQPREEWGMSTGKIVASMISEWIANNLGIVVKDLHKITLLAGQAGITKLSRILGKQAKTLIYTAMTDGGRAVKERVESVVLDEILDDIDIAGCYGTGLKNQPFAVGNPTLFTTDDNGKKLSLRQWLKENKKELIPGLWYMRLSWKNSPFNQDLLISKIEGAFTNWENGVSLLESEECTAADEKAVLESDKLYDASMVLTTKDGHQCSVNHDLLQIIQVVSSNKEWSWLLDNAVVESSAIYRKSDRVEKVNPEMLTGAKVKRGDIKIPKQWVQIDLEPLMEILLSERAKAKATEGKGSPKDTFLKLIINTIYGCIASGYFSTEGTGISNTVVGNNITARARALAWMMAKGFHSYCSITDGGVLDVNRVLTYRQMSLNIIEGVHRSEFNRDNGDKIVDQVPLFGETVDKDTMAAKFSDIDTVAWQHLKEVFEGVDIVDKDQFSFESKDWYVGLTMHSKVDYRLQRPDGSYKIALRGMPKIYDEKKGKKVTDPKANLIFQALEKDIPYRLRIDDTALLSLAEWHLMVKKGTHLLPHDEVSKTKYFYSHTPLGNRFETMSQYRTTIKAYEKAKDYAKATEDDSRAAEIVQKLLIKKNDL